MKIRTNQAILIFAIVVVLAWNYRRYMNTNKQMVEMYETDKEELIRRINSGEELKPVLTMVSVIKLTNNQSIAQRAYDLAASDKREELIELVESL
jgi:hypothetical protein